LKRAACYALHYGAEYLAWSIRSVQDAVDCIVIAYSAQPTYGHREHGVPCPESVEALKTEAFRFSHADKPIFWHEVYGMGSEGAHRDTMHALAQQVYGADLHLVVDADEVWPEGAAQATLDAVERENRAGRWLARFTNFWRSFDRVVYDSFRPVRVIDTRHGRDVDAYLDETTQPAPVLHFGYAQSERLTRYKIGCHGHKDEWRPEWFDQTFVPWKPGDRDLHPTVHGLWDEAHLADEATRAQVAAVLGDHPYAGMEVIR